MLAATADADNVSTARDRVHAGSHTVIVLPTSRTPHESQPARLPRRRNATGFAPAPAFETRDSVSVRGCELPATEPSCTFAPWHAGTSAEPRTARPVRCLGNDAFRVCHVSIQSNHLHFIIEAQHRDALAAGMQRLNILTARALNRELGRKGSLFAFRYHATQITSRKQARNSLAYVLNNWRKHREDEVSQRAREACLDPYASGLSFDGWTIDGAQATRFGVPADFTPLPVEAPRTWLLREGWRSHGLVLAFEVPGGSHTSNE